MGSLGRTLSAEEADKARKNKGLHDLAEKGEQRVYPLRRTVPILDKKGAQVQDKDGNLLFETQTEHWVFDAGTEASFEAVKEGGVDNPFTMLYSALNRVQRLMITSSPSFIQRVLWRDNMEQFINTESGVARSAKLAWKAARGGGNVDEMFMMSGAGMAGIAGQDRRAVLGELFSEIEDTGKGKAKHFTAGGLVRMWGKLGEKAENMARKREFLAAFEKAKSEGKTERGARLLAAIAGRELMDAARAGRTLGKINSVALFLNAGIQGTARSIRLLRLGVEAARAGDKKKAAALFGAFGVRYAVFGAVAFAIRAAILAGLDDDELEAELQKPAWKRDFNFIINIDGFQFAIAKPYEWGWLASGPERLADYAVGKARGVKEQTLAKSYDGYMHSFMTAVMPLEPDMVAGSMLPLMEVMFSKSLFTGAPIVPASEQGKDLEHRPRMENAGPAAKMISAVVRADARNVEHIIRGYGGGWGNILTARDLGELLSKTIGGKASTSVYQDRDVSYVLQEARAQNKENTQGMKDLRRAIRMASSGNSEARAAAVRLAAKIRKQLESE
jgi:hypothetical protein